MVAKWFSIAMWLLGIVIK